MALFKFEPWKDSVKLKLCGSTYCFELKDWGHRVHVYYREAAGEGSQTLDINLQKKSRYDECVRKMLELDALGAELEDYPRLYLFYKNAVDLFSNGGVVDLLTSWGDEEAKIDVKAILYEKHVYAFFRAVNGPYRLFYQADANTEEHDKRLKQFLTNAVGLYKVFRDYVKAPELQEKA